MTWWAFWPTERKLNARSSAAAMINWEHQMNSYSRTQELRPMLQLLADDEGCTTLG